MDSSLSELLKGPQSGSAADKLSWFRRVHDTVANAPEKAIQRLAPPLKRAAELLAGAKTEADEKALEPELAGLLLQAQGLLLYSFLEQLGAARNAIAAEASKMKSGSDVHKRAVSLQKAYEQTIDALALAYNGLREGKLDEMQKVPELLAEAQKVAASLRN